ncbi:RodZ domain-containing protein [Nocardioides sp. YIM 152315]|uniref:helix-turn-helix domain-containing protein n=1 Tax=Nocardioides sp. YIM 152315 TaxID=3031760 RepID=UPI0023DC7056|nr:RodZ domain-containing protein [Nocardioides sp. YIM 152315]MDF1605509.1 helix-turn-helix domain-containing protein [Nocardioides sp. YIM 152315]
MSNLSTADLDLTYDGPPAAAPGPVEVRRNGALAGGIGVVAAVVALAYLTRALGDGSWLDWVLALAMGAVAAVYLSALLDARTPLMVVDDQGIRVRKGRRWHGFRWEGVEVLEHHPRGGVLRDGRLVLFAREADREFSVPLSLSTWVAGAGDDLTLALEALADRPGQVVEVGVEAGDELDDSVEEWAEEEWGEEEPAHPVLHDPRPTVARGIDFLADRLRRRRDAEPEPVLETALETGPELPNEPEPTVPLVAASATPLPLRVPIGGSRVEVRFEGAAALQPEPVDDDTAATTALPEAVELRREPDALIVDPLAEPVAEPVVGPALAAARTRLHLTVDQLAERTRIRPHVIESIEVDDFGPCGGDFYARGHLRTLARVLGVDAAPLLAAYDERYADAPIDARRVFEAELATGADGPIRSMRGGPNWSVLIAAVMALVLAWSIARLIMDSPVELGSKPVLNGSPAPQAKLGAPVPVVLDAATGGTHVVVLDGAGEQVFNGDLAFGEKKSLKAAPPVRVQASDGGLQVTLDGQERGPLGSEGQPAQNTFAVDD